MISSVLSLKDVGQKTKSILGAAPTLEKSIEQSKEAALKHKLRRVQLAFLVVVALSLVMAGYFYSELSPDFSFFGANTTQHLADTNLNLRQVQTLMNKDRYLQAQFKLNELSYEADRFFSSVNSQDAVAMEDSQKNLPMLLGDVRKLLNEKLVAETAPSEKEPPQTDDEKLATAQADLRTALQEAKKKFGQNPTDRQDILDVKLIENTLKLVGNTKLLSTLQGTSTETFKKLLADYAQAPDAEKLKALQAMMSKILASTRSDLATIAEIKRARVEWSAILGHIKDETLNVRGSNFDQPLEYESTGGIIYNSYEFDSGGNKIVLSGSSKTLDGSNFTLMSNLVDQLENSQFFKDVEMRSFSKSKSGTDASKGYLANFKIDLSLETEGFSAKDAPLSLQSKPVTTAAGASRVVEAPASVVDELPPASEPPAVVPDGHAAAAVVEQPAVVPVEPVSAPPVLEQPAVVPVVPVETVAPPAPVAPVFSTSAAAAPSASAPAASAPSASAPQFSKSASAAPSSAAPAPSANNPSAAAPRP